MKNLAGDPECDAEIRRELARARIEIVANAFAGGDVPATLQGKLGPITFTRAWYYWVAAGPVPIEIARALYADPVGRTDVRVKGHCGCPNPDEGPWATHYAADGREIAHNPGDKERAAYLALVERGLLSRESFDGYHWAEDPRAVAVKTTVNVYHIDSEAGLRLFADAVRGLPLNPPKPAGCVHCGKPIGTPGLGHCWYEPSCKVERARVELAAYREALALGTSWPLQEVLLRLTDAAEHLLSDHSCDTHGHEGIRYAMISGRTILAALTKEETER